MTDIIVISHFGLLFALFYPSQHPKKSKSWKKWKKSLEKSSFYISVPKIMIRWCTVLEIWCVIDIIVVSHFRAIFCPFIIPLTAQKIKILKKWENAWRYHHFTYVHQKLWSDDVQFLRYSLVAIMFKIAEMRYYYSTRVSFRMFFVQRLWSHLRMSWIEKN